MAAEALIGTAGEGAAAAGASMFSSLLPVVGIGYMAYSLFSGYKKRKEQEKLQREQQKALARQNETLLEKLRQDKADLFSAVQSSVSQTSGSMGAVY